MCQRTLAEAGVTYPALRGMADRLERETRNAVAEIDSGMGGLLAEARALKAKSGGYSAQRDLDAKLDVLADQLAPIIVAVSDLDEVHALLAEHCRSILAAVADDMRRAATAAGQGGA